jgi:hypothetical protein
MVQIGSLYSWVRHGVALMPLTALLLMDAPFSRKYLTDA